MARTATKGSIAAVMVAAVALAACASHRSARPSHPSTSASARPTSGWVRQSFGSLSVSVPAAWKVIAAVPPSCWAPPNDTVTEATLSTITASSCPSMGRGNPRARAVVIECLVGKAGGLYAGASATWAVDGHVLRRVGDVVYLRERGAEGVVYLAAGFRPAALGERILASVAPSGRKC